MIGNQPAMALSASDQLISRVARPPVEAFEQAFRWRYAPPVVNDRQVVIRGGMTEPQRKWWNLSNFAKLLIGGYGSGKTLNICKRAIAVALENAPCPVATVSPTYPTARETVIATIAELLEGRKRLNPGFAYKLNKVDHVFTIKYHGRVARIICYSGDKPESLKGPNLASAYIDEPFIQDLEVFRQMVARVRHPKAKFLEIGLSGTPEHLNWGYDLVTGGNEIGNYDVGVVRASTRSNVTLSPNYIARLEGAFSGKEAEAYIEGRFVNLTTGAVFHAFDASPHPDGNVADLGIPPVEHIRKYRLEIGVGMDFNVNPMAFCVFWRHGDRMHFFDEFELPNSDTKFACDVLKEQSYGEFIDYIVPDVSGKARHTNAPGGMSDYKFIRQAGFKVNAPNQNPGRRDSFNAVNAKLKSSNGRITLTIDRRCKKLRKYLSIYNYENMHKQESLSHMIDAMRYPVTRLFPVDKSTIRESQIIGF